MILFIPVSLTEVNASGQPYRGMGVSSGRIEQHKEQWNKIIQVLDQIEELG